jgi:hypothetical protein
VEQSRYINTDFEDVSENNGFKNELSKRKLKEMIKYELGTFA